MNKIKKEPIYKELMSLPTQNYWVTFTYSTKRKPDKHLYFSFAQFDLENYFPRVNRFFDFDLRQPGALSIAKHLNA